MSDSDDDLSSSDDEELQLFNLQEKVPLFMMPHQLS